ncbi:E3 ubiquitin-protein ligase UBR4-like [Uloborus diversus]|uniref:E3 ubiquitin-protein ligase UBR4-like n=1 Tax=Uloborus diversus TaxID=327109 RepID=UPI002408FAF2|nr:E3 ubiquitin-protein ligase UBR4-like [Uloborus diversus]
MATADTDVEYAFREPSILLLTASQNNVNKYDVLQVIRSVVRRQQVLLSHDDEYENFFASFSALSAHFIITNSFHIPKSQIGCAAQACKVLLQYFLHKLQHITDQCCISQKQIVSIIYGLCGDSESQVLSRSEVPVLTLVLKAIKDPPAFAIRSNEFQDGHDDVKEPKRPRLDPSASILEQLMTPMLDSHGGQKQEGPLEVVDKDGDTTIIHIPDPGQECKALLLAKNKLALQLLSGVDVLLDMSLSLPILSQYTAKLQDSLGGKGLLLPSCTTGALRITNSYKALASDIETVGKALSLPVLEPLTEDRMRKLMKITLSCLYASITVATSTGIPGLSGSPQLKGTNAKDDENESCSVAIVETSLEIYNTIAAVISNSTRAGGYVLQNLHMIGSWILLGGLQYILNFNPSQSGERAKEASSRGKVTPDQTPSKAKDTAPTTKPIILKIQQGCGVLSVALATHAMTLLSALLDDLRVEVGQNLIENVGGSLFASRGPFTVADITEKFTAWQRVQKLTSSINLTNLLFSLASVSYRKACMLKRIQKNTQDGDNFSSSDSNTYYEDDFSSSEDSSVETDDDSEPILGQWFEETLDPPEPPDATSPPAATNNDADNTNSKAQQQQRVTSESGSLVPDKGEPNGYISLASKIFTFMNNFLVNFDNQCIKTFLKYNLGESQMIVLAGIIKDLDRETSRTDNGSICIYFGPVLGQLYDEFSQSLAKFIHNILATNMLSDNLQNVLLAQLGVSPWNQETWPLQVFSRTLSVLAQTLLLRQQKEKDELRSESEASCVLIWQRLLNTLKRAILTPSAFSVEEGEDINVEHAQLLLFLFHNLHLMQKKSVLLMTAQTIMEISPTVMSPLKDLQILYLARMLLIFEYMMRNLYDAPPSLIEQIQKNLFSFQSVTALTEKDNTKKQTKLFFACKDIEENYVKNLPPEESQGAGSKPKFFNLMSVDFSNQEVPKLDGFALSFILSSGDILKYPSFYYSIQNLVYLASQCDMPERVTSEQLSFLGYCAIQYSMSITWRLLLCLPPSVQSLESISTGTSALNDAECLHAVIWASRATHKVFSGWMKDTLVKQGLTTQKAEVLSRSVAKNACTVKFDIKVAKQLITKLLQRIPSSSSEPCSKEQIPRLFDVFLIECAVAKVQVALDEYFSKPLSENANTEAKELAQEMLPIILQSIEMLSSCIRWNLLHQFSDMSTNAAQSSPSPSPKTLQAYNTVLRMASGGTSKVSTFTSAIADFLPPLLRSVLGQWNSYTVTTTAWRNDFANDIIPSESYISSIENSHMNSLSSQGRFTISPNLKRLLHTLVRFAGDLIIWCPESNSSKEMIRVMLPLLLDATTESVGDYTTLALERLIGAPDGDEHLSFNYFEVLTQSYDLLINHSSKESDVDERILHECLKFMESLLDKSAGKKAMETFFTDDGDNDMVNILLSAANSNLSPVYGTRVLKFFSKLFQQREKNPGDKTLEKLCSSLCKMSKLGKVDSSTLQQWLSKVIFGGASQIEEGNSVQENRLLLQSLTSYIVKQNSAVGEKVANTFLSAVIPMGSQILSPASEGIGFSELMVVMAILSGAGSGAGHVQLFKATPSWLELCKKYLAQKDVLEKLEQNVSGGKHQIMMESTCYLLSYMADIVGALRYQNDKLAGISRTGTASPPCESDLHHPEMDSDWAEDVGPDEEESAGEDSDEDSLCNKLCTFTITQKEFMNQHWYHCHTCKMIDGVGVCTICAKVCHKDHDVTYAKFGSFFCDCGAKEDGSCQALVKRSPKAAVETGTPAPSTGFSFGSDSVLPSSLRRRPSSPSAAVGGSNANGEQSRGQSSEGKKSSDESLKNKQVLSKQLEASREVLLSYMSSTSIASTVLELLSYLMPAVRQSCQRNSPIGSSIRAQSALVELHSQDKVFEQSDQLMVPTLGSQEGAFENVRMNYSGEQGQTIRQLIGSHMIRRVAMCCLASPQGKRQHLAVSHEKGKITLLQLSALLKQADSSKRKLTLTRLASAPVPFMVLSITGNPYNEDFLAVCGLKDCHILTFSGSGSVSDHLVLHPQLESGNYIIKAMWLPGSQTELALVTADMVKIYDLSQDALSPQFFFLLPSEKIRDCCFIFSDDGQRHLVLMSSAGHIYYQPMVEESCAKHGPFYVTNILETKHPDLKDSNGMIGGGGVSIYYSHTLQLLFFSYTQGKSFIAPLSRMSPQLSQMFLIQMKNNSNNGNNSGNSKPSPQPLCQWSEVANHPGLILAQMQASNNPVILMVKPDTVLVQEIKFLTAKSKITDMVAIRHIITCGELRTTLILLCEDGSLRIYMANQDQTNYWLTPAFQSTSASSSNKPLKKKKAAKSGRPVGSVSFPVDFFEHCTAMNDIEFGGNDVLQVYNTQQIKHRLNTTGLYIASTKPAGFTIEVTNADNSMVMVGCRILVGNQDIQRAPSYIEIFGRSVQVNLTRNRWYDFPFSREESLTADKKLSIFFGASSDSSGVTMVDSIKIFGKTKESFGWPEDNDDFPTQATAGASGNSATESGVEVDGIPAAPLPLTPLDRLVSSSLELLDGCFSAGSSSDDKLQLKNAAIDLTTSMLTLPTPSVVHDHVKILLSTLHNNRNAYCSHKDEALLNYVLQCLNASQEGKPSEELDGEALYRLVAITRGVAVARPANLVRFAENHDSLMITESAISESDQSVKFIQDENSTQSTEKHTSGNTDSPPKFEFSSSAHFIIQLTDAFWHLHSMQPSNPAIAPVSFRGLVHVESTVHALIEVIHAFTTCDLEHVALATKLYVRLLLCEDTVVSFAAKQALIRVLRPRVRRRKVFIPSPPHCSTPGEIHDSESNETRHPQPQAPSQSVPSTSSQAQAQVPAPAELVEFQSDLEPFEIVEGLDPLVLLPADGSQGVPNLEALIAGPGGFPMLDMPPDDDETMVELAIALSLQDQPEDQAGGLSLQALSLASQGSHHASSLEGGHYSDTTASAGGSDDEGSTAATDGSTLRTSPAEQGGSAGSESGGSGVESIMGEHNVSGRSSAYGDNVQESIATGARSETSSVGLPSSTMPQGEEGLDIDTDVDTSFRLHTLRLMLLEKMLNYLPELSEVGGVRAIPFMQVILMLTSDLVGEEEKDCAALTKLLPVLISALDMNNKDISKIAERTPSREVNLIVMRLLSIMMSRVKGTPKSSLGESSTFCSSATAMALVSSNAIDYCLQVLKVLLDYWKGMQTEDKSSSITGNLLKSHPLSPPPDMSPFFLKQYVKGHANDIFEAYPQLLTEMVLRLPYQIKKILNSVPGSQSISFSQSWFVYLCEYMMMQQTPFVRRQVRKLLLFICGSKDKYRQLRDFHALESHMKDVKNICDQGGYEEFPAVNTVLGLSYDSLINMIEHLKACSDIATSRTINWQKFCQKDESILPFLIHVSFLLDEGVSSIILQLLQCALCGAKAIQQQQITGSSTPQVSTSPSKARKEKEKAETDEEASDPSKTDIAQCMTLAQQVNKFVDRNLFSHFICAFLLESNSTSVRWQAHSLIFHLHKNSTAAQQETLLDMMWKLWPRLPAFGRRAAQFVDLLGYFTLNMSQQEKEKDYIEKGLEILHQQNQLLMNHPNSNIYNSLQGLVEFDGYYLESEPCLVCNNPEVPYTNIKLSAIKVDSRFTTTTQIVKLIGSHTISKITLRIGDLKRNKMVHTLNIYYNNRSVQSVVELKNRPWIWNKAKKCTLAAGQTELKIEFPLPIVACNLMIEYADFYENIQASSETLQCPRCSASVPANPGVCANCGENVFQCHKCRAINYDEKDPFLCNSCGFCKYAKFDYTITAKPCCAVDPIENEEDRKKAISTINSLLEKADRVYKQLIANKPALEGLLLRIYEHGLLEKGPEESAGLTAVGASVSSTNVNRAIQQLAQRYCADCKASFDELSKIVQKVLASRKELVDYERRQRESRSKLASAPQMSQESIFNKRQPVDDAKTSGFALGKCYGCASSAVEHCITLLRALSTNTQYRLILCSQGLIRELVAYNLRHGNVRVRHEVRQLLCSLTRDNPRATSDLNSLLMEKIAMALKGHVTSPDLAAAVRHEVALLASSLQKEDSCWEQRLRCVMKLFLMGVNAKSSVVMESITLPCLKILQVLIKPEPFQSKKNKDKNVDALATINVAANMRVGVDLKGWLAGDTKNSFRAWKSRMPPRPPTDQGTPNVSKMKKDEVRAQYLMEKYGGMWREKTHQHLLQLKLLQSNWLRLVMFNPSSQAARTMACNVVEALCQLPSRRREVLDMLTAYLDDLGTAGESAAEFLSLYQNLISPIPWKHYLALRGLLPHIGNLITREIEHLSYLEETTLNSDLSQGYALKMLTELLESFIEVNTIRQHYKSRLVGCVLNGYLSLRKLVVQRTKLIDETQEKLLELLEEMTTGTESETMAFMAVCVETVKKYGLDDLRTPVFIFERLCSVIFPEESDSGEFYIILEKDPQQEDFLQGRMLGNPYSSNEPGMGPLMRDVKNKICQDCELVALLEDDSGMELLVNNKIINLDLPIKDVYRKVWCAENNESEAMRVVYRMRGLLGDATEEFIENLDTKDSEEVDEEEVYKMANVMSQCGGLEVMLERLATVTDLARGRSLLTVLLKLFGFCIKVKSNRQRLVDPEMKAVKTMLGVLRLALSGEGAEGGPTVVEQLLQIMETILVEASAGSPSESCGDREDIVHLLSSVGVAPMKNFPNLLPLLMRVVPFLAYGSQEKMESLIDYFKPYLNFNKFDYEHTVDDDLQLECFCMLCAGIECNDNGNRLKDLLVEKHIVQDALEYITAHAPPIKSALLGASDEWKEFTSKPALKYVLKLLTGLSQNHEKTQHLVSAECIPIIHRLEQVSSDERVGSLAENLMEAIKRNPSVAQKIEEVRKQTKDEKKRLAMAMREKQLGALGMSTNEKGQVTAKSSLLKHVEELGEESGLVCIICREGYKFQPTKVLGIYTFTKRCHAEEFENRSRKTPGYSTVTHFNVVHVDCHMAAVRHARGRDEWESAALQNANTKCNGLLPLWGPQVPESAFASCLARHNTYLQECTGHRDVGYSSTVHDLKLLLHKFAFEKSFSEDSGGGGPQSNMHLIPYLIHMTLYVINTTRFVSSEEKNIVNFLEMQRSKWVENCYELEGPLYWMTMCVIVFPPSKWQKLRKNFLKRVLILSQARHISPQGVTTLSDAVPKDFTVYKSYLLFFGLIDGLYKKMFKKVAVSENEEWAVVLADYVRQNDQPLLEAGDSLLRFFEDDLMPVQSFAEFCDVLDLLHDIPDPQDFLEDSLRQVDEREF